MDEYCLADEWARIPQKSQLGDFQAPPILFFLRKKGAVKLPFPILGRGEKIRTSDPLHPMQVRYQAALRPERQIL